MYKIELFKYRGETNNIHIKGKVYHLRPSKSGEERYLSTENNHEVLVGSSKISRAAVNGRKELEDNFEKVGDKYFDNFREYRKYKEKQVTGTQEYIGSLI